MGIFDRLGGVLRSYLAGGDWHTPDASPDSSGDPDLEAAYEELDEFLRGGSASGGNAGPEGREGRPAPGGRGPPEELRGDFAELGLPFGASAETCKAAYKKLLNIHHPDRHAGHEGNMKKATEKSARINAAYDRIEKWRKGAGR